LVNEQEVNSAMQFGIMFSFVVPPDDPAMTRRDSYGELKALLPLVEELGYDSFHTTEHHFQFNGWCPSPLVVLATAAGVTDEIRLVTNILLVPLYHPVRLAEDVASLDNLSNGRVTLGVSPGYVSEEFAGYGVPYEERLRRFEEALDLLQTAWTNDTFSFEGEFFTVPETELVPKPVQQPHPPLWYGVSAPGNLRRAAQRRATVVASPRHTVAELKEQYARYEHAAAELGWTPSERPVIREVFLAETVEKAEELAAPAVTHLFGIYEKKSAQGERALRNDRGELVTSVGQLDYKNFKSRYVIGDPDTAIREVEELRQELHATEVILRMQLPYIRTPDLRTSIELFAREVMPAFKQVGATA
jgi:probable F420-dependent oxidoreductase